MPKPKKGEPGYLEYRAAYNARRRARFENPEYKAAEKERMRERAAVRRANRREAKKC